MAKTEEDVPGGMVWQAQQAALMRLQLYLVMGTHTGLRGLVDLSRAALEEGQEAGDKGQEARGKGQGLEWDALGTMLAVEGVTKAWTGWFGGWRRLFEGLRREGAALPFGTLGVLHREAFTNRRVSETVDDGGSGIGDWGLGRLEEATREPLPVVFDPQLKAVLDGAASRVYGDGFNLSQRIWQLDQVSLTEIRRLVYEGVASGDSAWRIAQRLEGFLGAGAGCPRWARSRLYQLTKGEIASGDRTGLYTGEECDGQGVAYNALRLARNEIQIAHHAATDYVMSRIPWIEQERVLLSPAHPEPDVCDDVVGGGERGDGVYAKGEIGLPLHPQCLCYKQAVLMPPDEFADRLRDWMQGGYWDEMDQYTGMVGADRETVGEPSLLMGLAGRLALWLWGDRAAMDAVAAGYVLPQGGQLPMPW